MLPILKALHDHELSFAAFSTKIHDREVEVLDESIVADFSKAAGEYSQKINDALKVYAGIDYNTDPDMKTSAKARINYAYDFLSLLIDIVKAMDASPVNMKEVSRRFDLLEDLLLQKEQLVQTTYLEAAKLELASFHDPSIRNDLEEKLARFINKRSESG